MSINKDALIEVAPKKLAENLLSLPQELLDISVAELEKKYKFDRKDRLLRKKFQDEYNRSMLEGRQFVVSNVFNNVISENAWRKHVITNQYRLAYMMHPIREVDDELKILEEDFLNGLREIAEKGPFNKSVKISDYLAAAKMVLSRTAPTVQRQEIKQMNLKADLSKGHMSNEQLNGKIRDIIEGRQIKTITPTRETGEGEEGSSS